MSHPEQIRFFELVAEANPHLMAQGRLLEIGSYDVNGTVRDLWPVDRYVGVDLVDGPGVDVVGYGHEVDDPDGSYDVTISGECFEHDPHWADTLTNMIRLTAPGGLVVFSCASKGRPEHGTRRTEARHSPGTQAMGHDYYGNLTADDVAARIDLDAAFSEYRFWYIRSSFDLYFCGVRRGEHDAGSGSLPATDRVEAIESMMTTPQRIIRLPLRPVSSVVQGRRYHTVILPYWRAATALVEFKRSRKRSAQH